MKKLLEQLKTEYDTLKTQLNKNDEYKQKIEFKDTAEKSEDIEKEEVYGLLLRDLGFVLASTITINEALTQVLEHVLRVKEIAAAGVYFFNMESGELEFSLSSGLSKRFTEQAKKRRGFQSFMYKKILRKGVPAYTKFSKIPMGSKIFGQENLCEIGVIPIKYANKVIGSFNIGSKSPWNLREETKTFIETIATQIGGALWRISSQHALQLSQKNFQLIFETIDDFIFILDTGGKIIKTNPTAGKRLGYTNEELIGMSVLNLHPPDKRTEAALLIDEILAGRVTFCPIPLLKKNGEEIPVETRAQRGEWNGEEVLYGISHDISDRIKASEELRMSENIWQFALESLGEGIWDWNVKTGKLSFSIQCLKMFGYNENDTSVTIDDWKNMVHPDDLGKVLHVQDAHLKGEIAIFKNEYRILCQDGRYKWVLDRAKVIKRDSNGEPERVVGIIIDISAQKSFENSLVTALQKEKEVNELKSQLVAMASHEFRTPLATMLMAAEILDVHWDKMPKEDIIENIKRIKNNIQFLKDTIEKTLNLSRLESGELKYVPVQTDLNDFLKSCINEIKKSETRHKISYQGMNLPLKTAIDRQMIKEVIIQLLSNSVKFSNPGTTIHVKLKDNKNDVNIQVSDKGMGIPEAEKEHIFDSFRRGSNIFNVRGTGIGLALSQKFILLHGGKITVRSQLNKGTTFIVTLPKAKND